MSSYIDFVLERLAPLGRVTARRMFGGHCIYCGGVPFGIVEKGTLYLKADDINRPDFERAGLAPFRPFPDKSVMISYYQAPAGLFESEEELRRWGEGAVQAARRAQRKKKARKRSRASRS